MMRFDSATSSIIALLVNKSYKKTEKGKIIKSFQLRSKKFKKFFVSKVLSSNPSPRQILETIANFRNNFGNNCKF